MIRSIFTLALPFIFLSASAFAQNDPAPTLMTCDVIQMSGNEKAELTEISNQTFEADLAQVYAKEVSFTPKIGNLNITVSGFSEYVSTSLITVAISNESAKASSVGIPTRTHDILSAINASLTALNSTGGVTQTQVSCWLKQ